MILIGSAALAFVRKDLIRRLNDVDIIGTWDELQVLCRSLKERDQKIRVVPLSKDKTVIFTPSRIFEFEIAWAGTTGESLMKRVMSSDRPMTPPDFIPGFEIRCADLDELYTLKMSHRFRKNSPHFWKTRGDIMEMRKAGAKIFSESWFRHREIETYDYSHPNLNVKKEDFFRGDGIQYVYDHDSIHEAVAYPLQPAYRQYMKEGSQVFSSKKKFFELSHDERIRGVVEECYVLALERSQIPFRDNKVNPTDSFMKALEKVCTSITSGWFREFAWENAIEALEKCDPAYVDRFWKSVENGMVLPYVQNGDKMVFT